VDFSVPIWISAYIIIDMPRYVAFLRAINVGKRQVKMDRLRALFEELGFSNVTTFINSGNVIFDSSSKAVSTLEKKIEVHLNTGLGYEVPSFVRAPEELLAITEYKPFSEEDLNAAGNTLYVGFLTSRPAQAAEVKLLSLATEVNDFHISEREVYWLCRAATFTDAAFSGALLEKAIGMQTTLRNVNTIKRIGSKL